MVRVVQWWNTGRNERIANEDEAPWITLILDDFSQITLSDEAFSLGLKNWQHWRPLKAFTPKMISTGPTPLCRQLLERPLRFILQK